MEKRELKRTAIYLLRHETTREPGQKGVFNGRKSNVDINKIGYLRAIKHLPEVLRDAKAKISLIITSPRVRAKNTISELARGVGRYYKVEVDKRLDVPLAGKDGKLEGVEYKSLKGIVEAAKIAYGPMNMKLGGGESKTDIANRTYESIKDHSFDKNNELIDGDLVACSHGENISALLRLAFDLNVRADKVPNGEPFRMYFDGETMELDKTFGWVAELDKKKLSRLSKKPKKVESFQEFAGMSYK